jgi:hypothetical protein
MLTVQVPTMNSPVDAAAWVTEFIHALPEELRPVHRSVVPSSESSDDGETLEEALERFRNNWPKYADRFMHVHEGMVELGFVVEWTGSRNYIAYSHPRTRYHFIEMNSSTVYFPSQRMKGKVLGARDFVTKAASVRLDGDEQVEFVLQMARDELT